MASLSKIDAKLKEKAALRIRSTKAAAAQLADAAGRIREANAWELAALVISPSNMRDGVIEKLAEHAMTSVEVDDAFKAFVDGRESLKAALAKALAKAFDKVSTDMGKSARERAKRAFFDARHLVVKTDQAEEYDRW